MANITAAIEKPIPKGPTSDLVGESVASRRSAAVLGHMAPPHASQSGAKYSSIVESMPTATEETKRAGASDEDEIVDEIGDTGQIEESIKESMPRVDESEKQLSHMRAVIGSAQSIKDMGRDIVDGARPGRSVGPFNKSSF